MKIHLLLSTLMLLQFSLLCQTEGSIRIGGGLSYIKSGDPIYKKYGFSDALFAYSIAMSIKKNFSPRFDTQFEIQAIRQGHAYKIENYFELDKIYSQKKMISLTFNILPTYRCNLNEKSVIGFQLGAFSAYNMFHRWKYGELKYTLTDDSEKFWNLGFIFGLRVERNCKDKKLGFDLRFNQGLLDLSKAAELTKSRLIEIGMTYPIFAKK